MKHHPTLQPGSALTLTVKQTELPWVAQAFTQELLPGDWIFLHGDLGAGKTTFVQTLSQCLSPNLPTSLVSSPTFSILNVLDLKSPPDQAIKSLIHMDLYRIKSGQELLYLGLEELFNPKDSLVAIEWPTQISSEEWDVFFRTTQCPEPDRRWEITLEIPVRLADTATPHADLITERQITFCLR